MIGNPGALVARAKARAHREAQSFEFYPTPRAFTRWLFAAVPIRGVLASVCCGDGAIEEAVRPTGGRVGRWLTNDLDPRWSADFHLDASKPDLYARLGPVDWHVENPPFSPALSIIEQCLAHARIGVAMRQARKG